MRIGVTGFEGRLGSVLVSLGCIPLDCDVTQSDIVEYVLTKTPVDIIINCAAYTMVDAVEVQDVYEKTAVPVNVRGPSNIYNVMRSVNKSCWMIHISTDYIWNGSNGPYKETTPYLDDGDPVNSYGFTKFVADAMLSGSTNVSIVRTTGLFGSPGFPDFVMNVFDSLTFGTNALYVTKELITNQTYIPFLARDLIQLSSMPNKPDVLHLASKDLISRYEFALSIASVFGLDKTRIVPVMNKDIQGWTAKRPTKGGLKTGFSKKLGFKPYSILDGLKALRDVR